MLIIILKEADHLTLGSSAAATASASVISKAARILESFTVARPQLTLADLSRATGMNPSTTLRRANDLLTAGLLERGSDGRFAIGSKVRRIAAAAPLGAKLTEVALPIMQDIFAMTRYDVALIVREGSTGLVAERLYGSSRLTLYYGSGESAPLHATGGGLALLAYSPEEVREQVLAEPLPAITPYTCTDTKALREMLSRVRTEGYVLSERGSNVETTSIGAPVFNAAGEAVAGLSVIVKYGAGHPPALIDTARVGARIISRQLGARRPAPLIR